MTFTSILGVPIAASMAIWGIVFIGLYYGGLTGIDLTGLISWSYTASYTLSMIPLFILMGEIVGESKLGKDAFDCFYKWLSKVRGSLAIVVTLTGAVFGTITGSSVAAVATVGSISSPEMKRRGYNMELRLGSIAVCGILAALIPPSNPVIFYSILTDASIGRLFIAAIIPGIVLTILFSITIYIWVSLRPSAAPTVTDSFSLKEKIASLKGVVPLLLIFLGMMGGIYRGVFSPTEAAGIGATYTIVLTLLMRRLTWQRFGAAMRNTIRTTAFIMVLVIGAMIFAHSVVLSRLPQYVSELVFGWGISPLLLILSIISVFLIFGCFLDFFGLMVLFVPLFYPVVIGLGFSDIWFGILVVVVVEIALITPPIAANIYVAQSLEPEATTGNVVRGVIPFYAAAIMLLALLIIFPQLALWLPGTMVR